MSKNRYLIVLIASSFLFSWEAWALECQWWQSKVRGSVIPQHPRKGHTVSKHPRQEHCRERWKGADLHITQFKDDPIPGWVNKGETFKKWNRPEIQTILDLLPKLPPWAKVGLYTFRRADKSIHQGNAATSELTKKTIIFYDAFFTYKDKLGAIGHEASHFVFQELTNPDISEFEKLSGWKIETKGRKVYVVPPSNLLMPDSAIDSEEDFTNHAEIYISNPDKLKKINPRIYEFFLKRLPK
jgi:hypothetical protein